MVQKKRSNFKGKVAANAIATEKQGSGFGYLKLPKGIKTFSPDPDGRYKLDFLPYEVTDPKHPDRNDEAGTAVVGSLWWRRPYKRHTNIGANNDSVVCLTSIKKKCPICEHRAKMAKEGAVKEDLAALNASDRCLYIVKPLDSKKHDKNIHVFDISIWNFQNLMTQELKEDDSKEIFPDLEEGLTVKVRFEEKTIGKSKPFPEAGRIDFLERDEQYDESILEEVPNLDELLQILSYDQLQAMLFEIDDEEEGGKLKKVTKEDDDDEDEGPTRKRKTVTSHKKEEEEDEPEEEEEEEEPPRKKTTRGTTGTKRRPAKEEEDEEEEPPKRTGKKKSDNPCPSGYRFGVDTGKKEECDDCEVWDECMEEKRKRRG